MLRFAPPEIPAVNLILEMCVSLESLSSARVKTPQIYPWGWGKGDCLELKEGLESVPGEIPPCEGGGPWHRAGRLSHPWNVPGWAGQGLEHPGTVGTPGVALFVFLSAPIRQLWTLL